MKFALIGAAGYIAPKHLEAIKHIGGELVCAYDPHDSVGILDRYFPQCRYFREFERFDRHCEKVKRQKRGIDYVTICSPNWLHDAHCRFALRIGANAICEKPLVLHTKNLDGLAQIEQEYGKKISVILQLRHHQAIQGLQAKLAEGSEHQLRVTYYTPRGSWYHYSWKGDTKKSGGLYTNIGIHLFDMAIFLLGPVTDIKIDYHDRETVKGLLTLERGTLDFDLSISLDNEPKKIFFADAEQINFLEGFTDLHNASYESIIAGHGFGIEDARPSLALCERIRKCHI